MRLTFEQFAELMAEHHPGWHWRIVAPTSGFKFFRIEGWNVATGRQALQCDLEYEQFIATIAAKDAAPSDDLVDTAF